MADKSIADAGASKANKATDVAGKGAMLASAANPATAGLGGALKASEYITDPKKRRYTIWGCLSCCGCCAAPFILGLVLGIAVITQLCVKYTTYLRMKSAIMIGITAISPATGVKVFLLDRSEEVLMNTLGSEYVQDKYNKLPGYIRESMPLSLIMQFAKNNEFFEKTCKNSTSGFGGGSAGGGSVVCPDGTISVFAKNAQFLQRLNQNMSVYKQAAAETNVPWEVLAALHYREANMDPTKSLLSGESLGTRNPDDRSVVTSSLLDSAVKAGNHFRGKINIGINEGTLPKGTVLTQETTDMEILGKGFLWYNTGNHSQYGADYQTRNHSYVFNNFDAERQGMPFNNGGVHSNHDSNDGAYTVFALLKGAEIGNDGSVMSVGNCSTVPSHFSSSGGGGSDIVSFATQMPLKLGQTTNQNYGRPTHIVVHYTADNNSASSIYNYFQGTLNDNNSSNNIYVQFWVSKDGQTVQFTPANKQVAGAAGFNSTGNGGVSVSIENQGRNEQDLMSNYSRTQAQVDANVKLIRYLMDTYQIPIDNIVPHSAVTPGKTDPGQQFMQLIINRIKMGTT